MELLSFRPATDEDVPFLLELRRQTMAPHETASNLVRSPEENLRRVRAAFDCAQIIMQAGQPVGLLKVVRQGKQWELLQFQLAPAVQGEGLGSRILSSFVAQARAEGALLHLKVLKTNPARRLYERMGFTIVQEKEFSYEMALRA